MTYFRVIPRDLFNEANLLKCYGQLYLNMERYVGIAYMNDPSPGRAFEVRQDDSDGSTTIANVHLVVRGRKVPLYRPLNSREPWPLYARIGEDDINVFNDDGSFSDDMKAYLSK